VGWWRSTTANWHKFWRLARPEKTLLAQAAVTLPLIALGLCWPGFRRLHAWLSRWPRLPVPAAAEPSPGQWPQAWGTARLVQVAARYSLFRLPCLPRSLALWWLLRRQGIGADLRIGVTPKKDRLEAHAWVEFKGVALDDQDDVHERFSPFYATITPK
jgi:hypothetical protein